MTGFYWERHPDGPFATLIAVTATYCSPDADAEDYERLKRLAGRGWLGVGAGPGQGLGVHSQPAGAVD